MHESNAVLNARIAALEHQRTWAMTEWARDRANLQIASQTIAEQDQRIAALEALVKLQSKSKGANHGRSD